MEALLLGIFILGYAAIAFEHRLGINKAASALVTGVLCWTAFIVLAPDKEVVSLDLAHHLGSLSGILFFLMGAMTIVELIDAHDGFDIITNRITTKSKRTLLWQVAFLAFFLSALLDNLTTAIVMVTLIRKLLAEPEDRLMFAGTIVIAANAGGAFSPIGDVTTTMLWIGGQISSVNIIAKLIVPSLVCLLVPLSVVSIWVKGPIHRPVEDATVSRDKTSPREQHLVLSAGVFILILVPLFKAVTHLPPYMGMLLGLGTLWIVTESLNRSKNESQRAERSVQAALQNIDVPSILFFLGILIAIASLESSHLLETFAQTLHNKIGNISVIVMTIGVLSAIVDNVPLTAAAMAMYPLHTFPMDHYLWEFIAYCTGTGGSILIIGSAAGVAVMGMERIDFIWYLKRFSWLALLGFFAGAASYMAQDYLFGL